MHKPPEGAPARPLFYVGFLGPWPDRCTTSHHRGPYLDTARFEAAGGMWRGLGTCESCGSTVRVRPMEAA